MSTVTVSLIVNACLWVIGVFGKSIREAFQEKFREKYNEAKAANDQWTVLLYTLIMFALGMTVNDEQKKILGPVRPEDVKILMDEEIVIDENGTVVHAGPGFIIGGPYDGPVRPGIDT